MSYSYSQHHTQYPQSNPRSRPSVTQAVSASSMQYQDYISPAMSQYPRSSMSSYDRSPAPAMSYSVSSDSNCSRHTTSSTSSAYYHADSNASYSHSQTSYQHHYGSSPQDIEPTSPQVKRSTSRSSRQDSQPRSSPRYICVHPGCESSFSRPADLSRHQVSVHFRDGVMLDCPKPRCTRKGDQGFSRQDHLIEHLRQFHCMKLAKRTSKSQRRE
ncbi:hypothetical protein DIZ76_014792 [Coccidioides immitis]|nr:hypothetical protein DIZ76_014792 [Coccidioides immitis]